MTATYLAQDHVIFRLPADAIGWPDNHAHLQLPRALVRVRIVNARCHYQLRAKIDCASNRLVATGLWFATGA